MVIDAFQFFNELEILELRLHELDSVVDHFVILESLEMHGARDRKKTVLLENWDVVKPFAHKIKYVLLERLEPEYTDEESGWKREFFQREALWPAVAALCKSENDIIILSDCDEVPRAKSVTEGLRLVQSRGICRLSLDLFFYNFNWHAGIWTRSTIGTMAQYRREGGFQCARNRTIHTDDDIARGSTDIKLPFYHKIDNAGWHFSYFGDVARMRLKCASFSHSSDEAIRDWLAQDDKQLAAAIASGKNIFWRYGVQNFQYRPSDDPRLPMYLLNNIARYEKFTSGCLEKQSN